MRDILNHEAAAWDSLNEDDDFDVDYQRRPPRCRTCGSTEVRWRQQGGQWVIFSLHPGVLHQCAADELVKDFD